MSYLGDFTTGQTVHVYFTTVDTDGAPVTLAGTPAVSVYKNNSTTQTTTGVTLTVDHDGVTGSHHVAIDLSADGTFYAAGSDFAAKITAGTADGISVVGAIVARFSIENRNDKADVREWNGSAVATPTVAGVPEVDVTYLNGKITDGSVAKANRPILYVRQINADNNEGHGIYANSDDETGIYSKGFVAGIAGRCEAEFGYGILAYADNPSGGYGFVASGTTADVYLITGKARYNGTDFTDTHVSRIDAAVSSRLAAASYTAPDNASITAIKAKTDNLPAAPASTGDVTAVGTTATNTYDRIGAPAGASLAADVAAVKTDTGNLVTRITSTLFAGITSLANWLRNGKRKGNPDPTATSEINADNGTGTGTFDPAADSQEAIRDRGDAAWVTGEGGGGITVTPYAAATTNPRVANRDLAPIAQHSGPTELINITDGNGDPVDLSGRTIRFVVAEVTDAGDELDAYDDELTGLYQYETGTDDNISVGGADDNQVSVTHVPANTATAGTFRYFLWDVTDADAPIMYVKGKLPIFPAVRSVS